MDRLARTVVELVARGRTLAHEAVVEPAERPSEKAPLTLLRCGAQAHSASRGGPFGGGVARLRQPMVFGPPNGAPPGVVAGSPPVERVRRRCISPSVAGERR